MEDIRRQVNEINIEKFNEENREMWLSFSSENTSIRSLYKNATTTVIVREILLHTEEAVNLERLRKVGALLYNHSDEIIGPIKDVKINRELGRGDVFVGFDDTPEGNRRFVQVKNRSLRGVSVRARPLKIKRLLQGEEYQLGSKKIKREGPEEIVIVERWEPIEVSLLPTPEDIDVGVNDGITRSFFDDNTIIQNKEGSVMAEESKTILSNDQIGELIKRQMQEGIPEIVTQVTKALKEEAKPKMAVDLVKFKDLVNRAQAISPKAMNQVTFLLLDGKTEAEVLRSINDELLKAADGNNAGNSTEGDGTGRGIERGAGSDSAIKLDKVADDDFLQALKDPITFEM